MPTEMRRSNMSMMRKIDRPSSSFEPCCMLLRMAPKRDPTASLFKSANMGPICGFVGATAVGDANDPIVEEGGT